MAIDIDEVLVPFMESLFNWHNQRFNTNFSISPDMPYYSAHQFIGDTVEQFQRKIDDFVDSEAYRQARPINGAIEVLEQLKLQYELIIITARPESVRELTEQWVKDHFPATFQHVHFVPWVEKQGGPDKQSTLQKLKANVLVDDNLRHIEEARAVGVRGLLFGDYPWNQINELPKDVIRVTDWSRVAEVLL